MNRAALLCGENLPESCPTQTPLGHPMSMDEHHFTLEFAQWTGEQLAEKIRFGYKHCGITSTINDPQQTNFRLGMAPYLSNAIKRRTN